MFCGGHLPNKAESVHEGLKYHPSGYMAESAKSLPDWYQSVLEEEQEI